MEWIYILLLVMLPIALSKSIVRGNEVLQIDGRYKITVALIVSFIASIIIKGLAYNTGADFQSYYTYLSTGLSVHTTDFEFGFQFYTEILNFFKLPAQTFFVISSVFYFVSVIHISKKFITAAPFILFFWSLLFFNLSCNLYRQYYAFSFIFLAVYHFYNRELIKSVIWMFLSFGFHYSSIVVVPFFFLSHYLGKKNVKYWMIAIPIILSSIAGNMFSQVISTAYYYFAFVLQYLLDGSVYELDEMLADQYNTSYAIVLSSFFLVWSYLGFKIKNKYENFGSIYYMSVIFFILYPLFQQEILARILMYFQIFVPLFFGIVFKYYYTRRKQGYLPFLLLLASTSIYVFLFVYSLTSLLKNYPYQLSP